MSQYEGIYTFNRAIEITSENVLERSGMENYRGHYELLKKAAIESNLLNFAKKIIRNSDQSPVKNVISDAGNGHDTVYTKVIAISEERLVELLLAERTIQQQFDSVFRKELGAFPGNCGYSDWRDVFK